MLSEERIKEIAHEHATPDCSFKYRVAQIIRAVRQALEEDRELREQEEATKHDWRPVYVGVYSTTHRCLKCKLFHTVSIDIPASACPEYGCASNEEKDDEINQ